jgi:hypothetical protein
MNIYDGYVLLGLYLAISNLSAGASGTTVFRQLLGLALVFIGHYFG